jgi:hypothetical protein
MVLLNGQAFAVPAVNVPLRFEAYFVERPQVGQAVCGDSLHPLGKLRERRVQVFLHGCPPFGNARGVQGRES